MSDSNALSALETEIKQMIIEELDLEDTEVDDIDTNDALFVDGLGLDSIDALELGLAINKRFGVKLEANSEENKEHFRSVATLAKFVNEKRG
ncbi:phosphopantetheine-binding protein [Teredinibacter sp. KSP-S5-2]|uniref:phosphopantetheine-binding protein n=1 Tax=Teredinibacter sp. KSP-S5-2 TaxID=3034506 RepID=UPI002934B74A|nr:phosphopantetheine-binding protein [Teredinibacter sp. KSP-S5-2]WNO09239.1 phosphopantetheine-binding protein [Teredinibacter sp. KSP-S5-2]